MLKLVAGVALGVLLWSNPQARSITAHLLRASADYLDPGDKTQSTQGVKTAIPALPAIPLPSN